MSEAPGFGAAVADRLELVGSKASVLMDDRTLELRGTEAVRAPVDFRAAYQACFDRAIAHFVGCLRTGAPFETAPGDNLETLRLVEDAYRLAAENIQ